MTTAFPTSLDNFVNPVDPTTGQYVWQDGSIRDAISAPANIITAANSALIHENQHANINDAVKALETKVGVNSSADTASIDYKLSHLAFTNISGVATPAQLPVATSSAFGAVKPDNTTVTISGGVISAIGSGSTIINTTQIDQTPNTGSNYGLLSGTVDGVNTIFTVSNGAYVSGSLLLERNGQGQIQGTGNDWVELSPAAGTVQFNTAPSVNDKLNAVYSKSANSAGTANSPVILSTVAGINAKTVANTLLYTSPTGKTTIVTSYNVRVTAASAITAGPSAGVGNIAGTNNIGASQTMTNLQTTSNTFQWPIVGACISTPAGTGIYFNLGTASTGTSENSRGGFNGVYIMSELIPIGMDSVTGLLKIMQNGDVLVIGAAAISTLTVALVNSGILSGNNSGDQTLPPNLMPTTSPLTISLTGTGATGIQISATKPSTVYVTVSLSATASISGSGSSLVTLKKCATNSATESDWTVVGPASNAQSYALAVALSGTNTDLKQITCDIPVGWYVKAVASGTGTHTETIASAEKTIYG